MEDQDEIEKLNEPPRSRATGYQTPSFSLACYAASCGELNPKRLKFWTIKCLENINRKFDIEEILDYSLHKFSDDVNECSLNRFVSDIERFSEQIKFKFDIKKEMDGSCGGVWIEPIVFNISNIIVGRCNYERMLEFLSKNCDDKSYVDLFLNP